MINRIHLKITSFLIYKRKAIDVFITLLIVILTAYHMQGQTGWEKINGPLYPATPYSFLISSTGTQFVGTDGTGLFRSTDNGQTWELKNNGINSYAITSIAESPNGWIYAGTNYGLVPGTVGCLFRSQDNGETWQLMINSGPVVYTIKFNSEGHILVGCEDGMYISTDNGITWNLRNSGLTNYNVLSILPISNSSLMIATNDGVYYSTNNGVNWSPRNNGLIEWNNYYRTNSLLFRDDTLYVSCLNGLFYTTNFGLSWILRAELWRIENLEVDDNNVFYLNCNHKSLLRSYDYGVTWDTAFTFPEYSFFFKVAENSIYSSIYGEGLYVSIDSANTFTPFFCKQHIQSEVSTFNIVNNENWYAGTIGHGLFLSKDLGNTWNRLGPMNKDVIDFIYKKNGEIFVNCGYELYSSSDEGISWYQIPHPPFTYIYLNETQLSANDEIYATYVGSISYIAKLNNEGTWDSLTCVYNSAASCKIFNLIIDPQDDTYFSVFYQYYTGGWYSRTYKALNNFNSFQTIFDVSSEVAYDDSGNVFFGNSKMYKTNDRGNTIIEINNGITNLNPYSINVINYNEIYIGDYKSIYLSTNGGDNWYSIQGPSNSNGIHSVEKYSEGYLIIASGKGIYKNTTPVSVHEENSELNSILNYSLCQNYPNPFNPNTNIQYEISSKQFVTLKVYDVLGNEVATLVNEEKPAGNYEVEFDASNLSSGVYYYQLRSGDFVQTKKMILMK